VISFAVRLREIMNGNLCRATICILFILFSASCAPVISKDITDQVTRDLSFKEVLQNPEAYKENLVLWGGVIVGARNRKEGTLIEILQKPTWLER
jgi:outer membrane lipoprotein